jgi:hypothetical protein
MVCFNREPVRRARRMRWRWWFLQSFFDERVEHSQSIYSGNDDVNANDHLYADYNLDIDQYSLRRRLCYSGWQWLTEYGTHPRFSGQFLQKPSAG